MESVWYGESDLALTYLPVDKERFRITPLNRNELFLVVNKKKSLSTKEHVSFGDLKGSKANLTKSGICSTQFCEGSMQETWVCAQYHL